MAMKDMLKKMKMPEMASKDEMLDLEDMPDSEAGADMEDEDMQAEEMPEEGSSAMGSASDEDILKELEKRGFNIKPLLKEMESKEPAGMEDEESPEMQEMEDEYGTEEHMA